jgi:D-alanyl-D-alanine carboxypeptidase/D-alanyl-D-alanine-endopeptidase (penicillin-binding protein 4)
MRISFLNDPSGGISGARLPIRPAEDIMKNLRSSALLLLGILCAGVGVCRGGDSLADRIDAIIKAPEYRQGQWGILVADAHTGRPLYEYNADKLFAPASITKLYTCAAALTTLGPNFRFRTPVYRRGDVRDGRLKGDLILVGVGDPTLGGRTKSDGRLAFKDHDHTYGNWTNQGTELTDTDPLAGLKDLARQVKESGITRVEGEILVDDRLFVRARGSGSGPTLLTPIVVNDNVVDVIIEPAAKAGEPARIRMRPKTDCVQIDARVETVARGEETEIEAGHIGLDRFLIRGQIPVGARRVVRICPVDDPASFARALFIQALRSEGVAVRASTLGPLMAVLPDREAYAQLPRVAVHVSPPFSELIKVTLKVSHNLYASLMPLLLAVKEGRKTLPEGMRLEGKVLARLGVEVRDISLESGAGGGHADRVSPRVTVQLLREMARRPEYAIFKAALPVLGVDGTLSEMAPRSSPVAGKVHAKSGTYAQMDLLNNRILLRSKALAGTMTTAHGRELILALFVNDVPLPRKETVARESKVLVHLCEILYEHTP